MSHYEWCDISNTVDLGQIWITINDKLLNFLKVHYVRVCNTVGKGIFMSALKFYYILSLLLC